MQLVYSYEKIYNKKPVFLKYEGSQPVALFGGPYASAAINKEGAIIYIDETNIINNNIKAIFLPEKEKAVSVAFCGSKIISLGESGHTFVADAGKMLFTEIEELHGIKIDNICGIFQHCFALSKDNRIFAMGDNQYGQLALCDSIKKTEKFEEVVSLNEYKITAIYTGNNHSLFQTDQGKILACGNNDFGALFLNRFGKNENVYIPVETTIKSGAHFCFAGSELSAVFIGKDFPPNMPNKKVEFKPTLKDIEIEELKSQLEEKDRQLFSQSQTIEDLQNKNSVQKSEITELKAAIKNQQENPIFVECKQPSLDNFFISDEDEENYKVVKKIGEGATSVAYKVIDNRTSKVMCKKVLKTVDDQKSIQKVE